MSSGGGVGDLLDLHAAGLRGHEDDFGRGAVEDEAKVELAVDGGALLDEQALDFLSGGAGLVGDELHAEDGFGGRVGGLEIPGELDAAAFAAAASVDLRFDDNYLVAGREEGFGGGIGLLERGDHLAVGYGHTVSAQDFLGLVLVNLHGRSFRGQICGTEVDPAIVAKRDGIRQCTEGFLGGYRSVLTSDAIWRKRRTSWCSR